MKNTNEQSLCMLQQYKYVEKDFQLQFQNTFEHTLQ